MKNKNIDFIQSFNKITIKGICDELGINHKNIYSGKASDFNLQIVYALLLFRIKQLLLKDECYYPIKFYERRTGINGGEKND